MFHPELPMVNDDLMLTTISKYLIVTSNTKYLNTCIFSEEVLQYWAQMLEHLPVGSLHHSACNTNDGLNKEFDRFFKVYFLLVSEFMILLY